MGYKIDEDCFRYNIRDSKDKYVFSTDTKEKANKIINALEKADTANLTLRNSGVCECPNCKTIYSYTVHCGGCGQKLNMNSVR